MVILNIIVLLLEVLYYSLFMKSARPEAKLYKYGIVFSIATVFNIIFSMIGLNGIIVYLLFMLISLYGLKFICKLKISLFDLLFLFIIMAVKIALEGISFILLYNLLNKFIFTIVIDIFKFIFLFVFKKDIKYIYDLLKIKWNNNNFYIRYIFNVLLFVFIIMTIVFMIIK